MGEEEERLRREILLMDSFACLLFTAVGILIALLSFAGLARSTGHEYPNSDS
jgi:hypothetical protein